MAKATPASSAGEEHALLQQIERAHLQTIDLR